MVILGEFYVQRYSVLKPYFAQCGSCAKGPYAMAINSEKYVYIIISLCITVAKCIIISFRASVAFS